MDVPLGRRKISAEGGPVRKTSLVLSKSDIAEIKVRKQSANLLQLQQLQLLHQHPQLQSIRQNQPRFGICFDVDGVLARGTVVLEAAVKAFQKLVDANKRLHVPVVFVTNALNRNIDKANQISNWLGFPINTDQMIHSPSPLQVFTKFHDKFCLVIGQGKITEIAQNELGFRDVCTLEDITKAYPLLDMVDHDNRKRIAAEGFTETDFRRVELVLLLGEPKRWESALQVLVDLLRTNGKPNKPPVAGAHSSGDGSVEDDQLPVIACNMDLQFMDRACMPRYGHGAFLVSLESLYKKVTGHELQYTALIGKPSEITYRYAEHALTRESKKMGYNQPIKTMYFIGDSPDTDIVGSNLYQRYIDRLKRRRLQLHATWYVEPDSAEARAMENVDLELPESRNVPATAQFYPQTVDTVEGILVCTGVYSPAGPAPEDDIEGAEHVHHGHRDFPKNNELKKPIIICDDVNTAIDYIVEKEDFAL